VPDANIYFEKSNTAVQDIPVRHALLRNPYPLDVRYHSRRCACDSFTREFCVSSRKLCPAGAMSLYSLKISKQFFSICSSVPELLKGKKTNRRDKLLWQKLGEFAKSLRYFDILNGYLQVRVLTLRCQSVNINININNANLHIDNNNSLCSTRQQCNMKPRQGSLKNIRMVFVRLEATCDV